MKLVAVVRVSQEAQATEGYGPAAQCKDMGDYAAKIGATIIETLEDRVSGVVRSTTLATDAREWANR